MKPHCCSAEPRGGKPVFLTHPPPQVSTQNCKDLSGSKIPQFIPRLKTNLNHLNHHITKGSYFDKTKNVTWK